MALMLARKMYLTKQTIRKRFKKQKMDNKVIEGPRKKSPQHNAVGRWVRYFGQSPNKNQAFFWDLLLQILVKITPIGQPPLGTTSTCNVDRGLLLFPKI